MIYNLFTDGACSPNPGKGGWAFIACPEGYKEKRVVKTGFDPDTTNNRMEMTAAVKGIKYICNASHPETKHTVRLHSDSMYLLDGIKTWMHDWAKLDWSKKSKGEIVNLDLWKEFYKLWDMITIECHYIRGHSGHPENEECDQLAVKEMRTND